MRLQGWGVAVSLLSLAFLAALIVGFVGGALMYLFMARVFLANERPLRASDFDMLGDARHRTRRRDQRDPPPRRQLAKQIVDPERVSVRHRPSRQRADGDQSAVLHTA